MQEHAAMVLLTAGDQEHLMLCVSVLLQPESGG